MLFSLSELIDIVVMTLVIGFIFKDLFKRRPKVEVIPPDYDPLKHRHFNRFNWADFWFAAAVVAPSIILHEFGHKFVAMGFGLSATFHADYTWLAIALVLKLMGFPFIFLVPAFVSTGGGSLLQMAAVAFAGPGVNLLFWLAASKLLKHAPKNKRLKRFLRGDTYHVLFLTKRINMFLFIFNMLPIPGFDGWSFYSYLLRAVF